MKKAELREHRAALVAMVIRAAREVTEPRARANLLEDLEGLVPGALDGLPDTMQPAQLRERGQSDGEEEEA